MKPSVTKSILFDYFAGNASPLQEQMIGQWLEDPANGEFFYRCLADWEAARPQYLPDTEAAYGQFMHRLDHGPAEARPAGHSRAGSPAGYRFGRLLVAACLGLLLLAGGGWAGKDLIFYRTYDTAYGETRTFVLPDHSQVTLNAHSSLKVPRKFLWEHQREVWLAGEAFFSVSRRPDRATFTVHTPDLRVEVLGTRFNVSQRRGITRVVLSEGKVKLVAKAGRPVAPLLMQPGDYAELAPARTAFRKKTVKPEHYSSWQDNKLIFEQTPLPEVLQTVEDFYGVRFVLADSTLAERKFTSTLPNNDLDVVLKSLERVFGFEVVRGPDQILLQ